MLSLSLSLSLVLSSSLLRYLQYTADMDDLEEAFNATATRRVLGDGSCSALIKVLPNNEDLFTTHDTWSEYQSMLRVFKLYDLPYRSQEGSKSKTLLMCMYLHVFIFIFVHLSFVAYYS